MDITQVNPVLLGSIPVIVGVVQVIKNLGLPIRLVPLSAIILGIIVSAFLGGTLFSIVMSGLIVGLSSAGLYSGGKTTISG